MPLLISTKLFPIDLKYAEVRFKNGMDGVIVLDDKEAEKKYEGRIKELHTQWVMPGWKEHIEVIRDSMIWDEFKGERMMDYRLYRCKILENYLKAWDIMEADGTTAVPCNKDNIGRLDHNIAHALQDLFVDRTVPTEDELKN